MLGGMSGRIAYRGIPGGTPTGLAWGGFRRRKERQRVGKAGVTGWPKKKTTCSGKLTLTGEGDRFFNFRTDISAALRLKANARKQKKNLWNRRETQPDHMCDLVIMKSRHFHGLRRVGSLKKKICPSAKGGVYS